MTKYAYLVVWLDTERLKLMKIGIYSEPTPTPTPGNSNWQPAMLAEAPGVDYEAAERRLCEQIARDYDVRQIGPRNIGWVYPFLSAKLQARVRSATCPHCSRPLVREDASLTSRKGQLGQ